MKLTARQTEILDLIRDTLEQTRMPPTRAEIARHFGFRSTYGAEKHLQALAKKGAIELLPGFSRGIRLISSPTTGLPVVGRVAAGTPILAEEYIENHYHIDAALFKPRADYLLRVHGMSMKEVGIFDGDYLVVHKTPQAESGQIVVARIEGEVTVKRLHIQHRKNAADRIQLLPENADFEPILVDSNSTDFCIEGVSVGCIRTSPE